MTKYEHAALKIENEGAALIIDPGVFTSPLAELGSVAGVVLTHEHPDHWTPAHLDRILAAHPGIPIFAPEGVAKAAPGYEITIVKPGDAVSLAPFALKFFGGDHAVIHESIPMIDNVGVLVNDEFYYPGDSYAVPKHTKVKLLAAPVGAPWLKIGDAIDFVLAVSPQAVFATHDMTLSQAGLGMGRERLKWAVEQGDGEFIELEPGDSTEL
ncbi:L-ascorbate metabolism protein UlaG (beta-lactamase superfamily) [Microbacterium endophyticum]|uniref:L-ascorbate metabolism protein UlaG (Beta-lactamase superfamily) n=1 Tax=Microbacterium endophyticum TaxID=1526412 RepID=A0A7W4V181_9MICO|nr:L-ascorbate metabolism protein UlaG (beta-lactamase superfamily) [Microbacterium endophyticum]NIK36971.1 L-ascorbate metabolism protein UlaG (beta-lactamase superfamily) [Microbacterium endophyticum]